MKKVAKLKKLVSRPLQVRYLNASEQERESLLPVIEAERRWRIDKLTRKGYQLEATVAEVYGVFTRGTARGTLNTSAAATEATAS